MDYEAIKQHELLEGPLLNDAGNLVEAGYSLKMAKEYDRKAIKAGKSRIKEWDYYYIGNKHRGIALTIADNSLYTLVSCTLLDFDNKTYIENSIIKAFTFGKTNLPSSSKEGDTVFAHKGIEMKFLHEGEDRRISLLWPSYKDNKELRVDIKLVETQKGNSLVIATPFKKKGHFYYNQKINLLESTGYAKLGDEFIDFSHDTNGTLDWGRGVWTYKNTWYWSSMNLVKDGHQIGWNLGYGFGDTSKASENIVYVDGNAYKLGSVKFDIPFNKKGGDDFMRDWTFRSPSGDIKITFHPILNRHSDTNLLLIRSNQNQVFGIFEGSIRLPGEEGEIIHFEDAIGFAEKVYNRW